MDRRKGAVLIEAAIVYPLSIGAIMAVIYLIISLYVSCVCTANVNMELRATALERMENGEVLENGMNSLDKDKYSNSVLLEKGRTSESDFENRKTLELVQTRGYGGNGLIINKGVKTYWGRIYLLDETRIIRIKDSISI